MTEPRTIETARLVLRPNRVGDLPFLTDLMADPDTMRWVTGEPRTPEESRDWLEHDMERTRRHGWGLGVVFDRACGEPVGRGGVFPVEREDGGVDGELAWMIHPSWRGRGYATEIAHASLRFAVEDLELERVFAQARPANVASLRVMERIGLEIVSRAPDLVIAEWPGGDVPAHPRESRRGAR